MVLMRHGPRSPKVVAPPIDYRKSHATKGADYDQRFVEHAYRALLWDLEREALDGILPPERCREMDLLDFACGTGRVLRYLMGRVGSATGVDVSASMLAIAARSTGGVRLVQGDVTRESVFPSASFDLVTAFRFFSRAEAELRSAALVAIHDLLRPDGSPLPLFRTDNSLQPGPGIEAHVGSLVSRRVMLENNLDAARIENVQGKAAREPLVEDNPEDARNRRISIILLKQSLVMKLKKNEGKGGGATGKKSAAPPPKKREDGVIYFP